MPPKSEWPFDFDIAGIAALDARLSVTISTPTAEQCSATVKAEAP